MSLKQEIMEQPEIVRHLIDNQTKSVMTIAAEIKKAKVPYVHIAARGTSDNAGRYASYFYGGGIISFVWVWLRHLCILFITSRPN
jgi:glucosamine--fructose-6-phosphate aminotransferase (isomerizing)